MILGSPNVDYNKIRITLGAYAQASIGTIKSITQSTVGEISLRPENERGGHYFMSLDIGKNIHTYIWIELPINEEVIHRVGDLDTKGNQQEMTKVYPILECIP